MAAKTEALTSKTGVCPHCGYNVLACTCEPAETNTCKGASEASPGRAPPPERPEAAGVASGRKRQARKVMPLIGPLLDAWEGVPNDVACLPELEQVRRYVQCIHVAMEDA